MRNKLIAALLAALCIAPLAHSLPDDRSQPINIESDSAERNEKIGTTVYEGSVIIKQGSIQILADKVTVFSSSDTVDKIICLGKPAHYQQQPKPEEGLVMASANTIEYYLGTDNITLIDNASLIQGGTTISGERIDYDLKAEVVKAKGDTSNQRIQMVIPPSAQKESD